MGNYAGIDWAAEKHDVLVAVRVPAPLGAPSGENRHTRRSHRRRQVHRARVVPQVERAASQ